MPGVPVKPYLFVYGLTTEQATTVYGWELVDREDATGVPLARGAGCAMSGPGYATMSSIMLAEVTGIVKGLETAQELVFPAPVISARNQTLDRVFPLQPAELPTVYHEAGILIDMMGAVRGQEIGPDPVERITAFALAEAPHQPGKSIRKRRAPASGGIR